MCMFWCSQYVSVECKSIHGVSPLSFSSGLWPVCAHNRSIASACCLIWVVQRPVSVACYLKSASHVTQVTQLLDGMTPGAVRLDVRTSDFDRLKAEWAAKPGAQVRPTSCALVIFVVRLCFLTSRI